MNSQRSMRVLLIVLLVSVPALVGVLAGSSVESEAAGLSAPQAAHGSDFTLLLIQPDGSLWASGGDGVGQFAKGDATHTITASAGSGGSISPSGAVVVTDGANQDFTIDPDPNYHVADVLVGGSSVGAVTSYTFTNVTADSTISASFAIDTHTITASAGSGGSISPSGAVTVNHAAAQVFTITPATNYHVADVLVGGSSVGAVTSYTFTNVTADSTISASFAIDTHTITASAGSGGSISPSGAVTVNHAAAQVFTITPATNYHVADVLVGGSSVGAVTSYTFTNVTADSTISASFAIDTHTITASAGSGGSISPSGAVTVNHAAAQVFTITPATNYHVADVLVGGSSVGAVTSYTFTNVTADSTISASFAIDTHTITASAGSGGSISPSGAVTVNHAAAQVFTITPATNYHVADVLVGGSSVGAVTSYTFTNVTADSTISANFAIDAFTLTYAAGANGTISGTTPQTVNYGASATAVTAVPNTGYHFVSWSDGVSTATRTDAGVTADHTVTASFAINTFTLTPTAGLHGAISPASPQTIAYGADQAFTITPATGYHIADVLVDDVSVGPVTSYTFSNVTAIHTISASFAINTYTITPSAGANGSISPNTPQTVAHGADQAFTIAPATGHYVVDVLVDGVSVGPVTSYTFTAVSANHAISVSFAPGVQTRLSINVGTPIVNYGSSTLLTGVLYDSGDPLHEVGMGDRLVAVQSASSATGPWVDLETLTTSSVAGSVGTGTLTVTPTSSTYYRLRFVAGAGSGYGGSISFVVRVGVRPVLGAPKVPSSAKVGRSFTVYGALNPQFPAGQKTVEVKIYRYKNRHWVFGRQISATNADSDGNTKYSVKVKVTNKGKYRFRAYTAPTATWAGDTTGLSTVLTVR